MFLIGIGNESKSTGFSLLADKTIGYTLVPISGYSYYYYTSTTGVNNGGTAETLAPVSVYQVPAGKITNLQKISLNNTHATPITYDLAILNNGETLSQANSTLWDQSLGNMASHDVISTQVLIVGEKVVVLPSSVNTLDVKVYGTESNSFADLDFSKVAASDYQVFGVSSNIPGTTSNASIEIASKAITNITPYQNGAANGKNVYIRGLSSYGVADGSYTILTSGWFTYNGHNTVFFDWSVDGSHDHNYPEFKVTTGGWSIY